MTSNLISAHDALASVAQIGGMIQPTATNRAEFLAECQSEAFSRHRGHLSDLWLRAHHRPLRRGACIRAAQELSLRMPQRCVIAHMQHSFSLPLHQVRRSLSHSCIKNRRRV